MKMSIEEIKEIIPHRNPFLLVDRITDMEAGKWAMGLKCVTANEPFFQGHFPGRAVMPGALIIEALAQTGSVAILSEEKYHGKIVMFGGIKNCRFRKEVVPGDVLELCCEITGRRGPVGFGKAVASVKSNIVAQAELSFIVK